MNQKNLKLLITAAILILAVCLGLTLAMRLRQDQPQETGNPPAQETGTTQAQDAVTTPGQDLAQDATQPIDAEQDMLPLDTSDGLVETKPAESTGNQANPGTPPDFPTQPSETTATEAPTEEPTQAPTAAPTEAPTEEPTEGTLPPNMLPIG